MKEKYDIIFKEIARRDRPILIRLLLSGKAGVLWFILYLVFYFIPWGLFGSFEQYVVYFEYIFPRLTAFDAPPSVAHTNIKFMLLITNLLGLLLVPYTINQSLLEVDIGKLKLVKFGKGLGRVDVSQLCPDYYSVTSSG